MPMRGANCVGILKLWTAQPRPAAARSARIAHRHVVAAAAGRTGRYLLFCIRTKHRAVYNVEWQFSALCSSSSTTHLVGVHPSAPPFTADGNFSLQIACSWTRAPSRLLLVPPLRAWKAEDLYYAPAELLSD